MKKIESQIKDTKFQIIKDKLYFVCSQTLPQDIQNVLYFNIDDQLEYVPINQDFGPLDISCVVQFVKQFTELLHNRQSEDMPIYFHTCTDYQKYTNAILLLCAYQLIIMKRRPEQIFHSFSNHKIVPFRDSSLKKNLYQCTILHCLKALEHAIKIQWFNLEIFDTQKYQHYSDDENGNFTEIIPGKFVVCKTLAKSNINSHGNHQKTFKDLIPIIKEIGITKVIDISEKPTVDQELNSFFKNHQIQFQSVYLNKQIPTIGQIQKFIDLIEKIQEKQKYLLQCSSGLGKSCMLIGCYAIKHYFFNAKQFIAWSRLCRPGSIVGGQQFFLLEYEQTLLKDGQNSPIRKKVIKKIKENDQEQTPEQNSKPKLRIKRAATLNQPAMKHKQKSEFFNLFESTKF